MNMRIAYILMSCSLLLATVLSAEVIAITDFAPVELFYKFCASDLSGGEIRTNFDDKLFNDYVIEKLDVNELVSLGADNYYSKHYKHKKDNLLNQPVSEANKNEETNNDVFSEDDIRTSFMTYSFAYWINFVERTYKLPQPPQTRDALLVNVPKPSFFEGYCCRLINVKDQICHDIIVLTGAKTDFSFKESQYLPFSEMRELENYDQDNPSEHSEQIFRYATRIDPIIKKNIMIGGCYVSQYKIARTKGGRSLWAFLHNSYERRIKDTYVLVITSERTKIIIQSYCGRGVNDEKIEGDISKILKSIKLQ